MALAMNAHYATVPELLINIEQVVDCWKKNSEPHWMIYVPSFIVDLR